jgi:hypothetical protein
MKIEIIEMGRNGQFIDIDEDTPPCIMEGIPSIICEIAVPWICKALHYYEYDN